MRLIAALLVSTALFAPASFAQSVGPSSEVCVTPTVTASSAYTAGNEVGGLITFNPMVRPGTQSGVLESVRLTFKDAQTAEFDISFFQQNPANSTWTDKTTPSIAAGDVPFVMAAIKLTGNYSGLGTHTVYGADGISRPIRLATRSLYAVIVTTGTPTFASTTDVQLCASILQD